MRFLLILLLGFTLSGHASAYSYSAAGKEPLIDGRNGIVSGFQKHDFDKVVKYFNLMKDDIEFLSHKFDKPLFSNFKKAVEQKDQKAVLHNIHRLYAAEIQRRLLIAARNLDNYQSAKVMVMKSKRFFSVIEPELPKTQAHTIEKILQDCLNAIGKPGVFGAGQTPADPKAYQQALDQLVKEFAKL
ncbi:hypothetical protein GCM10011332_18520 [Terasakiella brassicae]|uniref:Uncharacterized protein n=1 Tax=Terasakiella brassicae TaxID=1634917 RepID=A0A917BZC2_9PROT|nr:hypothetical protein [Terasakiella brassicae]GGF64759.1 hypothetical protein GCM10011332_18520 [Terasakiella brassicae]